MARIYCSKDTMVSSFHHTMQMHHNNEAREVFILYSQSYRRGKCQAFMFAYQDCSYSVKYWLQMC